MIERIGLLLLLAMAWPAAGQTASQVASKPDANAEITVLPVRIGNRAMPEAGEVLAMFLEHGGMPNVDWTSQPFLRSGPAEFPQLTADFGDYVRRGAVQTAYALYAEIAFAPGIGITEIRGILADKEGKPVWSYRRTSEDEDFKKAHPGEPMECLAMLVKALREPLGLQDPFRPDAYEGRLTQRWAERTGLPTNSERTAMRNALPDALAKFGRSSALVFPVVVNGRPDRQQAARLAETLNGRYFRKAEAAASEAAVEIQNVPNEQQRLWQAARAFREHLRRSPAAADFAVFADYAVAPDGRPVAVHFVVCDRNGEWVIVDFQNDHWPDFRSMDLKSAADCDRLVAKRLDGYLTKAPAAGGKR
jgi:hypothetical protein